MNQLPLRYGIVFAVAAICACGEPDPQSHDAAASQDDETTELKQRVEDYYSTMSARDWDAYRDFFWPEATLTTVWQPPGEPSPRVVITTIDEFIANTPQGPDSQPIFEEKLLAQDVRMVSNLANVWARYEARFGDSTSIMTWRGIDSFTWIKHDDNWRIAALAYTDLPDDTLRAP